MIEKKRKNELNINDEICCEGIFPWLVKIAGSVAVVSSSALNETTITREDSSSSGTKYRTRAES